MNIQNAEKVLKSYKGKKRKVYAYSMLRSMIRMNKIKKIFGL